MHANSIFSKINQKINQDKCHWMKCCGILKEAFQDAENVRNSNYFQFDQKML
jgi:hypothetical protein